MVDLHIQSGYVYYIDNSTSDSYKGIYRSKTSGGYTMRLISSGIGKYGIQGLAVDWIAGMILSSLLLPLLSVILSNLKLLEEKSNSYQLFVISQSSNYKAL